jgi:hypothetical protein
MPFVNTEALDKILEHITTNATRVLLVRQYADGDTYAVVTGNKIGEATISAGDFALSTVTVNSVPNCRRLTFAGKTGAATGTVAAGQDLQFVFTDGVGKVLWATQETTNMAVTSGNPLNFPSLQYTALQPTA